MMRKEGKAPVFPSFLLSQYPGAMFFFFPRESM